MFVSCTIVRITEKKLAVWFYWINIISYCGSFRENHKMVLVQGIETEFAGWKPSILATDQLKYTERYRGVRW